MRDKWELWRMRGVALSDGRSDQRIRADLQSKGVSTEFSKPVAKKLAVIAEDLSPDEYAAVLDGVVAAYGAHCEGCGPPEQVDEAVEIRRLMRGFAVELRKLEEGLRVLSAYLLRLQTRTKRSSASPLH